MAKVNTNDVSLSFSIEPSLGTPGTTWFLLEPNDITAFGATITTTARRPISKNRQRRKGAVTDLESAVEFEHDLTVEVVTALVEQFAFAEAGNFDTTFRAAPAAATGYTIPSATANQAGKFQFNTGGSASLVFAQGYAESGNNGLKPLTADLAASGTELTVSGNTLEASPPTNARVELAGFRPEQDDLAITVTGGTATLTSNNGTPTTATDFTSIGLFPGQFIHIGGLTSGEQFSAGAGFARITAIAAQQLDLDKLSSTLATDPGTGETVDILYGQFIRNVDVDADTDDERFLVRSIHVEGAYPNLDSVGVDEYEYAIGNEGNTLAWNVPLTDLATLTVAMIGTDTEVPTTSRKTGADTPVLPLRTTAFGTASDVINLRTDAIAAADTCFKSATVTFNNNLSGEKCIGFLGNRFINEGLFEVNLEAQTLFTDSALVAAIRNNTTVTFDMILRNDNGAIAVDVPALTFGGGDKEFPLDASVLINITGEAFNDPVLGTSVGVSLFPTVPTS